MYFRLNVASKIQSEIDKTRRRSIYLANRFMRETVNVTLTRYGNTSRISSFQEVSLENLPDATQGRFRSLARGLHGHLRGGEGFVSKDLSLYYDLRGFLQ